MEIEICHVPVLNLTIIARAKASREMSVFTVLCQCLANIFARYASGPAALLRASESKARSLQTKAALRPRTHPPRRRPATPPRPPPPAVRNADTRTNAVVSP